MNKNRRSLMRLVLALALVLLTFVLAPSTTSATADVTVSTQSPMTAYFWTQVLPGGSMIPVGVLPIRVDLVNQNLLLVDWNGTRIVATRSDLNSNWTVICNGRKIDWDTNDDLVVSGSFPFTFLAESPNPVVKTMQGNLYIHTTITSVVVTWAFHTR